MKRWIEAKALKAAGCEKVYAEKMSGARSDRPQLARMVKALAPGDTIIVMRLDRLAASTLDLLHTVRDRASAPWRTHGRIALPLTAS